ncbi:MAG: DUF3006 domain-containing protein [Clostridia bacterium]|nr:DUF3006 domain-containing protein [Clostridia bacterium]
MEKLIVDRIVGDIAVLERDDRSHIEVLLSDIGLDIKEGSVLLFDGAVYTADVTDEDVRRKRIFEMQQKLKNRA